MLTRDLTPCFVQDFGLGSRTGYEKALLVGLFDRTFTCLDHRISSTDEDAGPTRRPVAVVMRRDGRLQEVDPWRVVIDDSEEVFEMYSWMWDEESVVCEHGKFVFVEVKSCMADFKSGHGLTFLGDENWLVCPRDLAHELYDERLLPFGVQVYCPDNGGALRLTYDLRMQAAKSLREDSTLCLLWAMLMDSYSRWRTTWDVFNETGESYDL